MNLPTRFINFEGVDQYATPHTLAYDAAKHGDIARTQMTLIEDAEDPATEFFKNVPIARAHAECAAHSARLALEAGHRPETRTALLPMEITGAIAALDYAYQDQSSYMNEGSPATDFGDEWPEARLSKIAEFKGMAALADLVNLQNCADGFRRLADQLQDEEDEYQKQYAAMCAHEDKMAAERERAWHDEQMERDGPENHPRDCKICSEIRAEQKSAASADECF